MRGLLCDVKEKLILRCYPVVEHRLHLGSRMSRHAIVALALLATCTSSALAEPAATAAPPPAAAPAAGATTDVRESLCLMIESAARSHDLPLEFFARVIWQESRFQADAVGPVTRSGQRAQGIAQFMPYTAAERGLLDPFDPVQALPKSAEFLRELRGQFGNLGLAAAAYNAGPQRVRDWMAGSRTLPAETRNYVLGDHRDCGRRLGAQRPARARAAAAVELHAADGAAQARAQSVRRQARGAGGPGGRQSVGRAAQRRLLTRSRAGELCGASPSAMRRSWPAAIRACLSTQLRSRGTNAFYQVRVGADTRAAADTLCGSIRRAGGACMVLRNKTS